MKTSFTLLTIFFFINISFSQNITDGLVAHLPFNGNADDNSGNENNGMVYGAQLTEDRFGNPNSAYKFDGTDDWIKVEQDSLFATPEKSIQFWFYKNNSSIKDTPGTWDVEGLVFKAFDTHGLRDYSFLLSTQEPPFGLSFQMKTQDTTFSAKGIDYIQSFQWYHVVGTMSDDQISLYINGELIHSVSTNAPVTNSDAPIVIGKASLNSYSTRYFSGVIDDFRIYNRILGQDEIDLLYQPANNSNVNFIADIVSGPIPLTVQFTDLSINATSWAWDFNNDGTVDSYEQNPMYTYFETDSFDVRLTVTGDAYFESVLKENYIATYQDSFPNIYSIEDIPNDQGGWVKVNFTASKFDTDSLIFPKNSSVEMYTVEIDDGSGWTAAASTAAYGKAYYSVLVPTTIDSTRESIGLLNFRIIAAMQEGNYVSSIATGYSVDNLEPAMPQGILAKLADGIIELSWQKNTENDFKYYSIYKSTNGSALGKIATSLTSIFIDDEIEVGHNYAYAVSASDHSGNESAVSDTVDLTVVNIEGLSGIPVKHYLAQNFPNPFNPQTTIQFGLPKQSQVKIVIYDVLGRLVKKLLNKTINAGHHKVIWDGKNEQNQTVNTGIYYYQIVTQDYTYAKKMQIIK